MATSSTSSAALRPRRFRDVADEARRFLSLPRSEPEPDQSGAIVRTGGSPESARRLFAMSQPISGTIAEAYLRGRGITALHDRKPALSSTLLLSSGCGLPDRDLAGDDRRGHRSRRRDHRRAPHLARPIGPGQGADRHAETSDGPSPGQRGPFRCGERCLAAGEGIETMLSLRCVMPTMPMVAALSAAHLAAILFPATLRRLYIARDDDPAGDGAMASLIDRANAAGIEAMALSPRLGDFNEDLRTLGIDALRARCGCSSRRKT